MIPPYSPDVWVSVTLLLSLAAVDVCGWVLGCTSHDLFSSIGCVGAGWVLGYAHDFLLAWVGIN